MIETRHPGVPLPEWVERHPISDQMLWKGSAGGQLRFVRDSLVPLVGEGLSYEEQQQVATVISSHRSKSIDLPVYQLARPNQDFCIILRDNFHNWKMSVLSDTPVNAEFDHLFHTTSPIEPEYTGDPLHSVYFEGFPRDLIFGYYRESDRRRWSAEIHGDQPLWTSVFLMMRSLGHVKPLVWHTKESHRRELGLA